MMKKGFILLILYIFCLHPFTVQGEEPAKIKEIRVEGNQRIEADAILHVIKARQGDAYDAEALSRDLKAVYDMGYFDDIRVEVEKAPDGATVIFRVTEKPTIREIGFEGNKVYEDEKIQENLDISSGSILNIYKIRRNIKIIESLYKERNYHNVVVTHRIEPLEHNQADLKFVINEGKKLQIKHIEFDGNSAYDAKKLKKVMKTSEKGFFSWITSSGDLNQETLNQDVLKLNAFYHNSGYAEARIADPEISYEENDILIKIKIEEGARYKMGRVGFEGDLIMPEEELLALLSSTARREPYYNRDAIRQDILTLTDIYSDQGYARADIAPEVETDRENLVTHLTFHIVKNQPVYFERIVIYGNTKTRDKVIRRELKVYEQELFNGKRLKQSIQDLHRLDFFEDIKVKTPTGSADDQMVLEIEVQEKATGTFSFGGGYSGRDGAYIMASVSERNLFGRGQYTEVRLTTGGKYRQYYFNFVEPWLFDIPLSSGVTAYKMERDYDDYDRDSTGGSLQLGYPLFRFTRGYIEYAYDKSRIDNLSMAFMASPYIQETTYEESSVSLSVIYDSRNRVINPSEGSKHRVTLQYAGIGGNVGFTKLTGEAGRYFPLFWGTVGFLHTEAGYVADHSGKELPDYERFYLGGIDSLRGFDWRDIHCVTEDGTEIGGDTYVQGNAEFIFPIIKKAQLMGLVVYDTGNVYDKGSLRLDDLRESAGFGIRWYSPMGPLRLERGYVLDKQPGEDSGRWEFSMGGSF